MDLNDELNTFIICHTSPRTICYLFYIMNSGLTLITIQPIDLAEEIAKFKFSNFWYTFLILELIAWGDIGGTFELTAALISLLNNK